MSSHMTTVIIADRETWYLTSVNTSVIPIYMAMYFGIHDGLTDLVNLIHPSNASRLLMTYLRDLANQRAAILNLKRCFD